MSLDTLVIKKQAANRQPVLVCAILGYGNFTNSANGFNETGSSPFFMS